MLAGRYHIIILDFARVNSLHREEHCHDLRNAGRRTLFMRVFFQEDISVFIRKRGARRCDLRHCNGEALNSQRNTQQERDPHLFHNMSPLTYFYELRTALIQNFFFWASHTLDKLSSPAYSKCGV